MLTQILSGCYLNAVFLPVNMFGPSSDIFFKSAAGCAVAVEPGKLLLTAGDGIQLPAPSDDDDDEEISRQHATTEKEK